MKTYLNFLIGLYLATFFAASCPAAPSAKTIATLPKISHVMLNAGPVGDYVYGGGFVPSVSPDGRWLVFSQPNRGTKSSTIIFYDFISRKIWKVGGRAEALSWRSDSRLCVITTSRGWALATPGKKTINVLAATKPSYPLGSHPDPSQIGYPLDPSDSCVAWGPKTGRLAIFDYYMYIFAGTKLLRKLDWSKESPLPEQYRAWDAEWSPDERDILLRYYGHADRDRSSPGHMDVLDPLTAKPAKGWAGMETLHPHWLDANRYICECDYGPVAHTEWQGYPLVIQPKGRRMVWLLRKVDWYELSRDRKTIWALASSGDLYRIDARTLRKRLVMKSVARSGYEPRTDSIWVLNKRQQVYMIDGNNLQVKLMGAWSEQAKLSQWRIIGWPKGTRLPLVLVERNPQSKPEIWQLQ
jgi:hypothetical protein